MLFCVREMVIPTPHFQALPSVRRAELSQSAPGATLEASSPLENRDGEVEALSQEVTLSGSLSQGAVSLHLEVEDKTC